MKRGKERRREEGRKAGRKGKKEGRKGGGEEGSRREGKDIIKALGTFSEDRFRHPFFLSLPKHNPYFSICY